MKAIIVAPLAIGILILLVAIVVANRRGGSAPAPLYTILHANGKPCPPGYHLVKNLFTEGDGTKEDAWVADYATPGHLSVDFLKPLESVSGTIFVPPLADQTRRKA